MMKRGIWVALVALAMAQTGMAEMARSLLTKENRFPALRRVELSTLVDFVEMGDNSESASTTDGNLMAITPSVRYRPLEEWTFRADLPVGYFSPDYADSEFGLGDLFLGTELLAYEHFWRFPYIIPHAALKLDTGSEDTTLGDGESSMIFGLTIGSKVYHAPVYLNFDFAYELMEDTENIFLFSSSLIWELSDRLDFLIEGRLTDQEPPEGAQEHPMLFQAGMLYQTGETWTLGLYGGGYKNADRDVVASVRLVKQF